MQAVRFDFVTATSKAYSFVWNNRRLILSLAGFPILIKLGFLSLIVALNISENFLRQGLILTPAYFLEGWLIAYLVRIAIFYDCRIENFDGKMSSQDQIVLAMRVQAILAATIVYVLIKLALSFFVGILMGYQQKAFDNDSQKVIQTMFEPSAQILIFAFVILGIFIYSFRYFWLNIAVALEYRVRDYISAMRGSMISFYIIGTWLLCFVPFAIALALGSEFLLSVLPGETPQNSAVYKFLLTGWQAMIDTAISIVAAVAMAYGISEVMSKPKQK